MWTDRSGLALDDHSAAVEAYESFVVAVEVALDGNCLNLVGAYAAAYELFHNVACTLVAETVVDGVRTGVVVGVALHVILLGSVGFEDVGNGVDDVLVFAGQTAAPMGK